MKHARNFKTIIVFMFTLGFLFSFDVFAQQSLTPASPVKPKPKKASRCAANFKHEVDTYWHACFGYACSSKQNADWHPQCQGVVDKVAERMEERPNLCIEVDGWADQEKFGGRALIIAQQIAGGERAFQAERARGRRDVATWQLRKKIQELSLDSSRVKEGGAYPDKDQRGVVFRYVTCPKILGEKGDQGDPGSPGAGAFIEYELGYRLRVGNGPTVNAASLMVMLPVSEEVTFDVALQAGGNEWFVAGGSLGFSWNRESRWLRPRLSLVGMAFDLDDELEFRQAEIGGQLSTHGWLFAEWFGWELGYRLTWLGTAPNPGKYETTHSAFGGVGIRF